MEHNMFCFQCEQTACGMDCTKASGVCGKKADTAQLQVFLGPTLPAFISPNVLQFLVENYNLAPITTPEEDLKKILG